MTKTQDAAVRNYLTSLRDPAALRDDDAIADLHVKIEQADDELARLQLRQQLLDLENPSSDGHEDAFVEHAKAWADATNISAEAFVAEGVPAAVLRRAGFRGVSGGRRSARSRRTTTATKPASTRSRVSADQVRAAIPTRSFSVKDLQEISGASAAVVRRVITEEVDTGRLTDQGADPDHTGPGRAPIIYQPA
jgi:tryptophanase